MGKKNRNKQISPEQVMPGVTEAEVREEVSAEPAVPQLDFDAWYALRKLRIPKHHHKEILKADFKARGLGQQESMQDFDAALEKYGVKLG